MAETRHGTGRIPFKLALWERVSGVLGWTKDGESSRDKESASASAYESVINSLVNRCNGLTIEVEQLRAACSAQGQSTPLSESPSGAVNWEEAYHALEAEYALAISDKEALLREVEGRKRAQHGSRSERITPEELLASLRILRETEPQFVPDDLLEEQERVCREREEQRQRRKKRREEKRRSAALNAARTVVNVISTKNEGEDGDNDDGGGGDGGGGGGIPTDKPKHASDEGAAPAAQVIPLRRVPRRNACLDGMKPRDIVIPVANEDAICSICHGEMEVFDYQDSHGLDIHVPTFEHLRYRQEKRVCKKHRDAGVVVAPSVPRPLAQALPTAFLLAFLIVAKVQDHLPIERLSDMFRRWGCKISPSTLGGWYQAAGSLLQPLAERLGEQILADHGCMQTDGTNIRVIDPSAPRGSTNGTLWGYTNKTIGAYFKYAPDGSYDDTRAKLTARDGPTMTDGHKGYASQRLPGQKKAIPVIKGVHLNCLDHARRPFEQAYRHDKDPRAAAILSRIQALYRVEAEAQRKGLNAAQIKLLRNKKSRPIFDNLFAELERLQYVATPKSRMSAAVTGMLRRKANLQAYLDDGDWPISNVLQESQFRSKALGQHSWLFLGSHATAPHYAALLSLVRTCMMLNIDPVAYIADVIMRIQERGSAKNLDALLPAAWRQANPDRKSRRPEAA